MLRYTLDDALVSAVRTSGAAAGDTKPVEEVQITFSKIRMEVMSIDPKGGSKPAGDAGWDLKANQKVEGSTAGPGDATASSTPPAPAGQSDTTAGGSTATAAPAGGTAAPAPAPAEPAGTTARPLTRAQRERLKLRQAAEPQPAPAPAPAR
jgi:hypothetical protein